MDGGGFVWVLGLPGGSDGKEPACNVGDPGFLAVQGTLKILL